MKGNLGKNSVFTGKEKLPSHLPVQESSVARLSHLHRARYLIRGAQFLGQTNLRQAISVDKQHLGFVSLCAVLLLHRRVLSPNQAHTSYISPLM